MDAASPGSTAGITRSAPFFTAMVMQLVERNTSTTMTVLHEIWLLSSFP